MKIIGISPLDKDATVCLLEDGKVIAAIAEERLSRIKIHAGFPYLALQELFQRYGLTAQSVDHVAYSFYDWQRESELMRSSARWHADKEKVYPPQNLFHHMRNLPEQPEKKYNIPALTEKKLYMKKPGYMNIAYRMLSTYSWIGTIMGRRKRKQWVEGASRDHRHWQEELIKGLQKFGIDHKLQRFDHHLCHAANTYFTSGFDEALLITLDGYGSGLAGSVSIGRNGGIERIHALKHPVSLGEFYEKVTSSLGFKPGRHEGKIVGLAAYEKADILYDTVRSFFETSDGDIYYHLPHNFVFSRYLASRFSKPAVAAAYQKVLEDIACEYIAYYVKQTGIKNVALSGGVVANVKANQRIFEIDGVENIFIHPNMGDGGCCVGAAMALYTQETSSLQTERIDDVYWGPEYPEEEMLSAIHQAGLKPERPQNIERRIAELLADGNIVARFNGRMEYGPRALGNRSILYHATDPSVNLWLNQQLKRTEFMPFAPATLYEERNKCYKNIHGAEYTAQFMTITFDCTDFMVGKCPAAVHVDKTARPQLVSPQTNESFYNIIKEYASITGIPSIINTSFNMHEEPIVCTPQDAIKAFNQGDLPYLAMGPFIVRQ
ncbi:MAG: carbamoyltransferase [Deltaproteobacteria bacterium]|nr:carbamoyltransferase [Deltaproteobacteria bacterium]